MTGETQAGARRFWPLAMIVTAAFALPLYELLRLSLKSELHSHLLLIPAVAWYVWRFLDEKRSEASSTAPLASINRLTAGAAVAGVCGLVAGAVYFHLRVRKGWPVTEYLWVGVLGYLLVLLGVALRTVGWARLQEHQFSIWFLAFFIPLPVAVTDAVSIALQHGSAEVTDWMLQVSGLPVLREELAFRLPRLVIRVAEECSGVRSTLVLVITSLIAGKMFLRTGWKRAVLALATIPLGLLRNAARITVLAWLSVNVDAGIINGPLHHRGGPIFFVLSLVPLFGLLWWFKRSESSKTTTKN
jgi:exosortase C (VPDSG-CTERM-specific)